MFLGNLKVSSLAEDSIDIFKRNNIDHYLARPSVSFSDKENSIPDFFSLSRIYCVLQSINKPNETNEVEQHQPNLLHGCLMKGNNGNSNYLKIIKMMNSKEKMQCPKVYRALRYNTPNKFRFRKKYSHHLLFLFFFISIRKRTS